MAFDIMRGFQVGQAMRGGSAIGEFVKNLTARAQKMQEMQTENAFKVQNISREAEAKAKAEAQYDPEKKFLAQLLSPGDGQQVGGPFQQMNEIQGRLQPGQTIRAGPMTLTKPAPKPLNPQQMAVKQNFSDLLGAINRIDTTLASDKGFKGQLFATSIPFQPGAGGLADDLRNAADVLLRMRSGAQINEKEYARLAKLLPTSMDSISEFLGNPNRARNKLVKFRTSTEQLLNVKSAELEVPSEGENFSQMSDEELHSIAGQ